MYSRERKEYYNRNRWCIKALENIRREGGDLGRVKNREWEVQRQVEKSRIREARYNKKYRELETRLKGPKYLRKVGADKNNIGDNVRALLRLKCGNMEDRNKY